MTMSVKFSRVAPILVAGAACVLSGCTGGPAPAAKQGHTLQPAAGATALPKSTAPSRGTPVCDQPILKSPWDYDGAPGTFTAASEPRGLPTFGSAGTDFPSATGILVVAAGDNTSAAANGAYALNNAVVYFEPGDHRIENTMNVGHNTAYVGGYAAAPGKAVIDGVDGATNGTGVGGSQATSSTPASDGSVYDTYEYLTIKGFTSSNNSSILGNTNNGSSDVGDTYKYDTIGPNEYGYVGNNAAPATGESNGGGYAIDAGSDTTIEHDCLTHDAQGGFNLFNAANVNIRDNEISWNGLGTYPDDSGPGGSPFSCGCSGGGKVFYSLNADFVGNYVHDNYNAGIWFDFDNAGALISDNYIASNWAQGIMYEASYNARITDNTLVGNGWASDGPWPAGLHGKSCYGGVSCTKGYGAETGAGGGFPYAAIYMPNSGGNPNLKSRYAGSILIGDNVLKNDFGGVMVYTDTNRYPGNIDQDSACSVPLGALSQNNGVYYKQGKVLVTNGDTSISGSSVTSSGGTMTICAGYGSRADNGSGNARQAPSAGMAVYDQNAGTFLGTVTSVSSAHSFTLSDSPGDRTGASLLLSAYGGCGPADYFGGKPGVASGSPKAMYWDNCVWGSRNVTVTGNLFSLDAARVTGCDNQQNMCGYMTNIAFNAGVPKLMQFFDAYQQYIAQSSGGLGNVWSDNTYVWSGSGTGWQFQAGSQGNRVSLAQWRAAPYSQDAGSTFK